MEYDDPIVDRAAGVVYLANQGAIEFHIWTSRKDALDRPDMQVFDLDPPRRSTGASSMTRRCARTASTCAHGSIAGAIHGTRCAPEPRSPPARGLRWQTWSTAKTSQCEG